MNDIWHFENVDIYLIDQLLKGRIKKSDSVLDAGCGMCRNLLPLHEAGYNITGFDPDADKINAVKSAYPKANLNLNIASIETYDSDNTFNVVICNAVLHFAKDHNQFDTMFARLAHLLTDKGVLFIRMTSNIGLENKVIDKDNGVFYLPDDSLRYLLTREKVNLLLQDYGLDLLEPV